MFGGYYLGQLYLGISGLPIAGILSVVPSSHQLSSDNVTLTQKHIIVIADTLHGLTSENITLTQKHLLSVDNAIHTLMSENVAITSEQVLGVNDAFHGVTSTEIALTQKHTIVVENTTHGLTSDNLDLVEHKLLVVANALHGHTAETPAIVVHFYLVVDNTLHGHTAGSLLLSQKHTIVVANTLHSLTSDTLGGLINIQPDGMGGGFGAVDGFAFAEYGTINIELPLNYYIYAGNALHTLSDNFTVITQRHTLVTSDGYILVTSPNLDMTQVIWFDGGVYIKDYGSDGSMGAEYDSDAGTNVLNNGYFGNLAPVVNPDNGFLIGKMGSSGSYEENDINSGIINLANGGQGNLSTEVQDTGIYAKDNNNNGEYEVI
jgi:hypothetical protein